MTLNELPSLVLTSHWTAGVPGVPVAAAVKVTLLPAATVWLVGWVVIETESTVSVAALVVALRHAIAEDRLELVAVFAGGGW